MDCGKPESRPATANQPTEDVPTPQAPRHFPTFTSPSYRQEEIASQGDPADMPELLPMTPGITPKATPKTISEGQHQRPRHRRVLTDRRRLNRR